MGGRWSRPAQRPCPPTVPPLFFLGLGAGRPGRVVRLHGQCLGRRALDAGGPGRAARGVGAHHAVLRALRDTHRAGAGGAGSTKRLSAAQVNRQIGRILQRNQRSAARFQITLQVNDLPGVLASVATVFAQHGVSVETVDQNAAGNNSGALLTIMTHAASEGELEAVVEDLRSNAALQQAACLVKRLFCGSRLAESPQLGIIRGPRGPR